MNRRLKDFTRWHVEKHVLSLVVRPDAGAAGLAEVGGALLPEQAIEPGWVCYCAGVGEDIRIEQFLAERCGARVWAFDPTPRSIVYMEQAHYERSRLQFLAVGLWNEDVVLRFHAPADPAHVSHSVMEPLGGGGHFEAPCRSVPSLMRALGHERIDLLKLNIEGAEHVVLGAALAAGILPRVVAVTFEGDDALRKARFWTRSLRAHGYRLLGRLGWFFTYMRDAARA